MKITEENFIKGYIELSIAQGEAYDAIITDKWKETRKLNNQLCDRLMKYSDFLADRPKFAKKVLDELIENENFYIMKSTASLLWDFNYRMKDCYKLFEKIISKKEKKYQPTVIAANAFFLSIKENHLKRYREFPKLD